MSEPGDEIHVAELSPGEYRVEIRDGRGSTTHHVSVPAGVGVPGVEEHEVVRESIRFLLEREPKEQILPRFDLPIIGRYFPEYPADIERRLGGDGA